VVVGGKWEVVGFRNSNSRNLISPEGAFYGSNRDRGVFSSPEGAEYVKGVDIIKSISLLII
jgi:hypothetical protein